MERYPYDSPKVPTKLINLGGSRASTWFTMLGGNIGGFTGWLVSVGALRDSFESLGPVLEPLVLIYWHFVSHPPCYRLTGMVNRATDRITQGCFSPEQSFT